MKDADNLKKKFTRLTAFLVIVILIFAVLVTRLVFLQIMNGDDYKQLAEAKGEKQILELAPRGEILDKNNKKIATNLQSFNIMYTNSSTKPKNSEINSMLSEVIKIIQKNNDDKKLNIGQFPIMVSGNSYSFEFNTDSDNLKVQLQKNFKKRYNIQQNLDARGAFYYLAGQFGLTPSSTDAKPSKKKKNDNTPVVIDYRLRSGITPDLARKIIALRLAISDVDYSQYRSVYIANNVKRDTAVAIMYKNNDMSQISCEVAPMRSYPNGQVGSAFLGYLGKIDENDQDMYNSLGYDINRELVGKMGLEKVLENNKDLNIHLRGEPGYKYVNVDKFGRIMKQTATLDPIPGDTVVTTIDMDLQRVAENALDQQMQAISSGKYKSDAVYRNANRGAAIVLDVKTGEVRALVSRPGFDPNWFAETGSVTPDIGKILFPSNVKDPADMLPKRMFNYATMGTGPPGSTFKPFVAISALQEGAITPSTIIVDRGKYEVVPGFHGACWIWNEHHGTHGDVNLAKALEVSCNYYFFDVGRRLGYSNFEKWAWMFGLASNPETGERPSTGIEIDEKLGEVSSPDKYKSTNINAIMKQEVVEALANYKYGGYNITKGTEEYKTIEKMFMSGVFDKDKLNLIGITNDKAQRHIKLQVHIFDTQAKSVGQLLNASIGQGTTLLTPIQMVSYISTLVNGGNRMKVHLVKDVLNPNGSVKQEIQPEVLNKIPLDPSNIDAVKEGMRKVTEEGGTASTAFQGMPFETGGKTGSASVSKGQEKYGRAAYGWFVGFAPLDNPQIAVCVVIYDAGHGGSAAPVARKIYDEYFKLNKPKTTPKSAVKDNAAVNGGTANKVTSPLQNNSAGGNEVNAPKVNP